MGDEAPSRVWFVSDVDRRCVSEDLGRQPAGRFRVAWRTATGRPGVIENHPIHLDANGRPAPFPTTHWLIEPTWVARVSRLEAAGGIAGMEAALADRASLAARVADDHRRLIAYRLSLLSREEEDQVRAAGRLAALTQRGIAGIADFTRVKCLHAWLAHHLVIGNALGPLLLEHLRKHEHPNHASTPWM